MKAQTFLLTAGVIIGILVALRGFATVQQISSERDILDISLNDVAFNNVKNEVEKIIGMSSNYPLNITSNSIDFINFTRRGSNEHSLDVKVLFIGILANSTNQTANITLFQFLKESDLNITIALNTSTPQRNSTLTDDGDIWVNNFSFTQGEGYNLTVTLHGLDYVENVTFRTRGSTDTYTGFFDLTLLSPRADHKNKFQQTIKVS